MRRVILAVGCLLALAAVPSIAQALVVTDHGVAAGIALVPGTRASLGGTGVTITTASGPCNDPFLATDLGGPLLPANGLCFHGGSVIQRNETFSLTWDPKRRYWQTTHNYVEQFLRDVADGSGTLSSPYAVTGQYRDGSGSGNPAAYESLYGGGCIDFGVVGGATCRFGSTNASGAGHNYPAGGCTVTGVNQWHEFADGSWGSFPNDICVTDAQLRADELEPMLTQTGLLGRTQQTPQPYTPLLVVLTPPGVVVCLDSAGNLCSANSTAAARFCSYHSQLNVGGTEVDYVVQPWTASWPLQSKIDNGCDDPDLAAIPYPISSQELAVDVGQRLVSPISQAQIAAVTDPAMNAWYALDGSEVNDNGCAPAGSSSNALDQANVAGNTYYLQREFNNGGVIVTDPNALVCTPLVLLTPQFVLPSAVSQGDEVQLDGSTSISSLIIPNAGYSWSFGDGTMALGPSVVHTYAAGGTYTVTLTVTDRGGNVQSLSQTLQVLGKSGKSVSGSGGSGPLKAHIQLMPQGLRAMLRHGVAVLLRSNEAAAGFVTLLISRRTARMAHIRTGRGAAVVVGRGTIGAVKDGTVKLHLHLSRAMGAKLRHLRHFTLTVHLALVAADRNRLSIDAAGRY